MGNIIDLEKPNHSYFAGFFMADGNFSEGTRNRGRVSIEIHIRDKDVLEKFSNEFSCNSSVTERIRSSNFKEKYTCANFRICSLEFRNEMKELGFKTGKKSFNVKFPKKYLDKDLFRGIIDGDGSLGITSENKPFISLVTVCENMKNKYLELIEKIAGQKKMLSRNKRDNAYNIAVFNEDAQKIVKYLYYEGCLCLDRKFKKAQEVLEWTRPLNIKKRNFEVRQWDEKQDSYILNHSIEESMSCLNRTKKSIKIRLWRLSKRSKK